MTEPIRLIKSTAPIRICDDGGWTDTWFARHGRVLNMAVSPCAEVEVAVHPSRGPQGQVVLDVRDYGDRYTVLPHQHGGRHPLLEATIEYMGLPDELNLEVYIHSDAPAGASTGTSAAVTVALIGALDRLMGGQLSPAGIARAAHEVETVMLGQQCGIQDQLCSAFGGINFIEMTEYPQAIVTPMEVTDSSWQELDRRLLLIYLGKAHQSTDIHQLVIRDLEDAGPNCPQLNDLRRTADESRRALSVGDLTALGAAMIENTEAQARLHPALIGPEARRIIEIARTNEATGWKVNGAGGEGGSITILSGPEPDSKQRILNAVERENSAFKNIPIHLSREGLRVWESE